MIFKTPVRKKPLALVVDDDFSMRLSMQAALEKAGFNVVETDNGRTGIKLFRENHPDLILLDLIMPEMDGFETCKTIRTIPGGEYVQILVVTGLNDVESTEKAFAAGANGFISKPINWTMLGHRGRYMLRAGRAFQELSKSKSRLAKTQQMAKLGNWEINLITHEFSCSSEARVLLGIKRSDRYLSYDHFFSTITPEERSTVREHIDTAIEARKSFSVNYEVTEPEGRTRHILNQGEIIFNEQNEAEILLGAVQDITQLKRAEEEIRQLAYFDGLTGLANRMFFLNRLYQEISLAQRQNQHLALLYLDLDQFKRVNDTFGHHVGDLLLQNVSEVLQNCIRKTDTASRIQGNNLDTIIARLGGDEFTILLPDIKTPENAGIVARRILKAVNKSYFLEGLEISISTSIGISLFPDDGDEADVLLKHADTAMYQAKNQGRNNFQFYVEELNIAAVERFTLERCIPKALEQNEFDIHYQPKINIHTDELVGAEALIRWPHPERGMISPSTFISIAEESGHIGAINEWVIESACRQWRTWLNEGYDPGVLAVNLSGYQFAKQKALKNLGSTLLQTGLSPEHLEIEITENILMRDTKETALMFKQLKKIGIRIALDDFGTGYSSLSYLTSFQVDTLKIDRSFVMGCSSNPKNLVIIKAIIAMGRSLGMKIIAEGVETAEELKLIQDTGADEAQGFYFSPPLPAKDFFFYLKDKNQPTLATP